MAKFVCSVCGYIYEGEAAPAECPVCHVGADKFKMVEGELALAAEHEYGVYAKTVKDNAEISDEDKKFIFDQLKANFSEMLGEDLDPNMKATTKDNIIWRVECEFGATSGKVDLAKCAKKNNLDAIHDTVHEMARDEARHGKAFKGLLERYFG